MVACDVVAQVLVVVDGENALSQTSSVTRRSFERANAETIAKKEFLVERCCTQRERAQCQYGETAGGLA